MEEKVNENGYKEIKPASHIQILFKSRSYNIEIKKLCSHRHRHVGVNVMCNLPVKSHFILAIT
jgi:hypothetical protein